VSSKRLLQMFVNVFLNFCQPAADGRFVNIKQLSDLAKRHLVIIVVSEQQPLSRFKICDRAAKRPRDCVTIAIAHVVEIARASGSGLLGGVSEAIHFLGLFSLNQPASLAMVI